MNIISSGNNIKRIVDPQQLAQRHVKQSKERERLMNFSIRVTLKPFKLPRPIRESHKYVQVVCSELDYTTNKFVKIGETECLSLPSSKQELLLRGNLSYSRVIGRRFELGLIQHMKVTVYARMKDDDVSDGVEVSQGEFNVSDMGMSLNRMHDIKLEYVKSTVFTKIGICKGIIQVEMIPPVPTDHVLPRKVNSDGTHLVLEDEHIIRFGETEAKQLSITLKISCRDLPNMELLSKSVYPYFTVFKDGVKFKEKLYRSETLNNTIDPVFRVFSFGLEGERSLSKVRINYL
jgi:hypothetical protein